MNLGILIRQLADKQLRKINPETARMAVLEYLRTNGGDISEAARVFGINRPVVYNILRKDKEGDLGDRSRAPKHQPNKTPDEIEDKVVEAKNKTGLGPERLSRHLLKYEKIHVPPGTIRHILRRNRHRIKRKIANYSRRKMEKREFVDWYGAEPFEVVQVDVKFIRDQKALTKQQIIHLDRYNIPNYQWGAIDVNSRFKLIAYSREKSWTNGLCFFLWTVSWLRSHGVKAEIVFTVDRGEELGGKSWLKVAELRKLLKGFGCRFIQNHKGHPEENAHLERSHRTDDDEFYIPRAMRIKSEEDLLDEALGYIYYYNNVREHSSLDYQTPYQHLKRKLPEIDDTIRYAQPILLDEVSVKLGPWSGYNVLAQHHRKRKTGRLGLPVHQFGSSLFAAEVNFDRASHRQTHNDRGEANNHRCAQHYLIQRRWGKEPICHQQRHHYRVGGDGDTDHKPHRPDDSGKKLASCFPHAPLTHGTSL